jgi:hypothetical protein
MVYMLAKYRFLVEGKIKKDDAAVILGTAIVGK